MNLYQGTIDLDTEAKKNMVTAQGGFQALSNTRKEAGRPTSSSEEELFLLWPYLSKPKRWIRTKRNRRWWWCSWSVRQSQRSVTKTKRCNNKELSREGKGGIAIAIIKNKDNPHKPSNLTIFLLSFKFFSRSLFSIWHNSCLAPKEPRHLLSDVRVAPNLFAA